MNALLRLLWALPLVLALGVGFMIVLRRFVAPAPNGKPAARHTALCEQLALSEQTRVYLLDVDGRKYLVVESTQNTRLQPLASPARVESRVPARSRPAWLRHLSGENS